MEGQNEQHQQRRAQRAQNRIAALHNAPEPHERERRAQQRGNRQPVSYTHLDVYKRQRLYRANSLEEGAFSSGVFLQAKKKKALLLIKI